MDISADILYCFIILGIIVIFLIINYLYLFRKKNFANENQIKYQSIFEAARDAIVIVNIDNGKIIDINEHAIKLFGYDKKDLIGSPISMIHPIEVHEALKSRFEVFSKGKNVDVHENIVITKHGDRINVEIVVSKLIKVNDKNAVVGFFRDITERKKINEELIENSRFFNDLLENSGNLIITKDLEGRYTLVNRKWEAVTGFKREDVLGKKDEEIFSNNISYQFVENNQERVNVSSRREVEQKLDFPDGTKYFLANSFPLFNSDSSLVGVCAVITDITQSKKDAEKLRLEQMFSDKILDSLPGIFYMYTYPELRLVRWNNNHETLLGYTHDEIVNRYIMDWQVPEAIPAVQKAVDSVMERGQGIMESPLLNKTGVYIPFLMTGVKFEMDGQLYLMGIGIDVTEQKKIERELIQSKEIAEENEIRFKALHNASFGGITIHDKGVILDCNQGLSEISGYSFDELIGMDGLLLIAEKDRDLVMGHIVSGYEKPYEVSGLRKNGDEYTARLEAREIPYKGKLVRTVEFRDITDQKKAALMIETKNKELEQIIYVTSHDLRSPLVNVDGYSREIEYAISDLKKKIELEDISNEKLSQLFDDSLDEMSDSLGYIRNSTKQMDALLKGLLKLSRLGRSALNIKVLNMNELLGQALASVDYQIKSLNGSVMLNDLPSCKGDFVQITQVFTNIIGNSLKYADPERPPVITITGKVDSNKVIYCVEDNGIGVSKEHIDIIFELFHRLDPKKSEGDGIGLTIVKNIVGRLDGFVWLESNKGVGTKFFVSLPYAEL